MRKFILFFMLFVSLNALNLKDANTTCPITLANTKQYPKLLSVIEYKNGKTLLFSSPKSMFEYIYKVDILSEPYSEIYVTNYEDESLIVAKDAFYIFGSSVKSKSGDDLVAFNSYENATKFKDIIGGSTVLKYNDINKRLIEFLNER